MSLAEMGIWKSITGLFILTLLLISLALFYAPDENLHLIACDVGQGDALLATYKDAQVLVDGGPDSRVLECLSKYLPFWDREIELVILTHPQMDHYGGLIEVFKRYKVDTFLTNKVEPGSLSYQLLKNTVGGSGTQVVNPREGMVLRIGLLYLDILHSEDSLEEGGWSDLNELSIVLGLRFKEFEALLTGDIPPKEISKIIVQGNVRDVEYIKIPHHGSKNGLTLQLLEVSQPEVAVISVGEKNSYGHPSREILELLSTFGVKVYRTDEEGDVETVSDGETFWLAK